MKRSGCFGNEKTKWQGRRCNDCEMRFGEEIKTKKLAQGMSSLSPRHVSIYVILEGMEVL